MVSTLPEYTRRRFGGRRIQIYLSMISLLLYVFTKISVNLYSGAIFLQQALGLMNLYLCIIVLLLLTSLCTVVGGLAAVIYTDTFQFFVMIVGSLSVVILGFQEVGGYSELQVKYLAAIPSKLVGNSTCGLPRTDSWQMMRPADPTTSDLPWPAFLLGQMPASIWYWCSDQVIVQRALAAKSLSHAQGATIFAGYMKILPLFIIVLPGMISRVLYPDEVGCVDPDECYRFCGSRISCTNSAYPKLVLEFLPSGARGIMLSVMLSAIMSNLTSIFNSASTLFTMDMWATFRPKAKPREQLLVGRIFIVILVAVSICWVPIIQQSEGGQLFVYIQVIAAYLAPPIAAVFLLAVLWPRLNESGAFWSLILALIVGMIRMTFDFIYTEPPCYVEDHRPAFFKKLHYMYFATLMFWGTGAVAIVISLLTKPPKEWQLIRTTYFTRLNRDERVDDKEDRERRENELIEMKFDNTELECEVPLPWYRRFFNFVFGYDNSKEAQERVAEMNEHLVAVTTLQQGKWHKRFLNTMLVIILAIAIILYVGFSINPFTEEEVWEIQRKKLAELGYEELV